MDSIGLPLLKIYNLICKHRGVAGLIRMKVGILPPNATTSIKLGAGLLQLNIGGSKSSLYYTSYWNSTINKIAGDAINDSEVTLSQNTNDKYYFDFNVGSSQVKYIFIGYNF